MGLVIEFALTLEFTDESFATEEAPDETSAGFSDVEFQRILECDDVAGVDGVIAIDLDRMDRTVTAKVQLSTAGALDPKHRLSAEEGRRETLPSRIDIDTWCGSKPTGSLDDHRSATHRVVNTVTEHGGPNQQRLAGLLGGEVIEEKALAREHSLQSFDDPAAAPSAFGGRLDGQTRRHGDHGSDLAGDRFTLVELESQRGGCRLA